MLKALLATLLFVFASPQSTPPVTPAANAGPPGIIEGRVIRTSTSEPIAGVQIILVPPAPPSGTQPIPAGQTPLPGNTTPPPPPPQGQTIQIVRGADGSQTIQNANGAVIAQIPPGGTINAQQLEGLLNPAASRQINTVTDSDGKFSFQNLAPGTYQLRAQRQGYFGPMNPQGSYAPGVAKTVVVESDKTAKVDVGMVQGGVLRGLVTDPDGQPAPNYAVVTGRSGYVNGRYIWLLIGAMNADDRGEYRWPHFAPGEYYVASDLGRRGPSPMSRTHGRVYLLPASSIRIRLGR
jgi:hypothetical protein